MHRRQNLDFPYIKKTKSKFQIQFRTQIFCSEHSAVIEREEAEEVKKLPRKSRTQQPQEELGLMWAPYQTRMVTQKGQVISTPKLITFWRNNEKTRQNCSKTKLDNAKHEKHFTKYAQSRPKTFFLFKANIILKILPKSRFKFLITPIEKIFSLISFLTFGSFSKQIKEPSRLENNSWKGIRKTSF